MNFEHIIAINDLNNPLLPALNRQQLWAGLMFRVNNPVPFLPGLEACQILERRADTIIRSLDFGTVQMRDQVTLQTEEWVRFDIEAGENHPGGSLTIRIEEPQREQFFLRFKYESPFAETASAEDRAYGEYLKSAYQQSDIDCVNIIRTLAVEGHPQ